MDEIIDFPDLNVETDTQRREKQIVDDLQLFIDEQRDVFDELEKLESNDIINDGIARLDEQCTHNGDLVAVYGTVLMSHFDPIEGANKTEPVIMNGQELKSSGFTVQSVQSPDGEGERMVVGHLFESAQEDVSQGHGGLIQITAQYFAFAPYGKITIESARTKEESIDRLWAYIPEIMEQVDGIVLNAKDSLSALVGLRKLSYIRSQIPNDVLRELIDYVDSTISVKEIGPITANINGVFTIDIDENKQVVIPLDVEEPFGGSGLVMATPQNLFLSQYDSYAHGETYTSEEMYWSLELTIHRAESRYVGLEGTNIDVMVGNLRDPVPVHLPDTRAL